ncbi:DNA polymerase III subunit beta [Virgibacillus sp. MG-45]|uniref:DNA polymerase III subunit beta n=1 Tax=Virgibacillus sp. MG-45 TaxID=3102791 RepID=UPI002ED7A232
MEFKINNDYFKKAVLEVRNAVSSKTTIPILTGMKIDAKPDSLTLTGSNSDFVIERTISIVNDGLSRLEILETGSIVLSAKYLNEIIKKLPNDIHFKVDENQLATIKSKEIITKMNGIDVTEYPSLPNIDLHNIVTINSNDLIGIIKQTIFAASKYETNPVLTGVSFSFQKELLTCIATNSHRLSLKRLKIKSDLIGSFIVPSSSLNELLKLFGSYTTEIDIFATKTNIVFKSENISFYSRLIEGNYPSISGLFSQQPSTIVTLDTKQLLEGIDRASVFANEWRNNNINFQIDDTSKIIISSMSSEMGEIREKQYIKNISGDEELNVTLDGNFMMEALKIIKENEVNLCFNGSIRPILIEPIGNDSHLQLISPVRTY